MANKQYIGRDEHIEQLKLFLLGNACKDNLIIQSIEGTGGIGKSSLLDYTLSRIDLSRRKYLTLRIDGSQIDGKGAFLIIEKMIESATTERKTPKPLSSYFNNTAKIISIYKKLKNEINRDLMSLQDDRPDSEDFNKLLNGILSTGQSINELSAKTKDIINFEKLKEKQSAIENAFKSINALAKETPGVLEKLGLNGDMALRNSIRENALQPLALALYQDLRTVLCGYAKKDIFKPTPRKLLEADRLLVIIDDYEKTQNEIGEFLTTYFLNHLKNADFQSTLIILGRDDIRNTHVGWDHHFSANLQKPIRLKPLDRKDMDALIDSIGNFSEDEKNRAWDDTSGYPLLVNLWTDEAENGGRTATSLKRFYDRTTRWMNDEQKKWLSYAIYMEEVNLPRFQAVLKNEHEGKRAWTWFENEGSVRDTRSKTFRVNQYLRSRLIEYLEIIDPQHTNDLKKACETLQCPSSTYPTYAAKA